MSSDLWDFDNIDYKREIWEDGFITVSPHILYHTIELLTAIVFSVEQVTTGMGLNWAWPVMLKALCDVISQAQTRMDAILREGETQPVTSHQLEEECFLECIDIMKRTIEEVEEAERDGRPKSQLDGVESVRLGLASYDFGNGADSGQMDQPTDPNPTTALLTPAVMQIPATMQQRLTAVEQQNLPRETRTRYGLCPHQPKHLTETTHLTATSQSEPAVKHWESL
jgi:hypothetical protein